MKKNQLKGLPFLEISEKEEMPEKQFDQNSTQPLMYAKESQEKKKEINNLPRSDSHIGGNFFTLLVTQDQYDFSIISDAVNINDISSNNDYHAILVKNPETSGWIDEIKSKLTTTNEPPHDTGGDVSKILQAINHKFKNQSSESKILLTDKRNITPDRFERAQDLISMLCLSLKLSKVDTILITAAGDIHNLSKWYHVSHNSNWYKLLAESNVTTIKFFNEQSPILKILMSLYQHLPANKSESENLEQIGANIITIVDLFFDIVGTGADIDPKLAAKFVKEIKNYNGKLFFSNITEAFTQIIKREYPDSDKPRTFNTIYLLTDTQDTIYSLTTRLKNEGFELYVDNNPESFAKQCIKKQPAFIVIRNDSLPHDIIRCLQVLSAKGINISMIPTFLMVKDHLTSKLSSLLEIGIQDIIPINGSLGMLLSKIKKLKVELEISQEEAALTSRQQTASRGYLTDMNLIDLIQALGPAKRTTRITLKADDETEQKLTIYLQAGEIIFASLGELRGPDAIYKAICWDKGMWIMEPIAEDELPQRSVELSNDAILMEGCRLQDEAKREKVSP